MKKFMTDYGATIVEVEVQRETEISVWINGRRRNKRSRDWANFFDRWDEAKAYLMEKYAARLAGARRRLEIAQSEYGNVKGLKPPVL